MVALTFSYCLVPQKKKEKEINPFSFFLSDLISIFNNYVSTNYRCV